MVKKHIIEEFVAATDGDERCFMKKDEQYFEKFL